MFIMDPVMRVLQRNAQIGHQWARGLKVGETYNGIDAEVVRRYDHVEDEEERELLMHAFIQGAMHGLPSFLSINPDTKIIEIIARGQPEPFQEPR